MAKEKLLKVMFLGGVGEIGKNMTALEYGDSIILIDAGMSFPTEDTPGIDLIVPDISYIKSNKEKLKGIVITHGHEDHIGGLAYVLEEVAAPVYGTAFTLGVASHKLEERKISSDCLHVVEENSSVKIGCFEVEFIKVCHSIAGASALAVSTPVGTVFVTGDFKMDYTPIDGKLTNIERITKIGSKGVLLMLGESTNVEKEGHSKSESKVAASLETLFNTHRENRLIVATFASNNYRVQTLLNLAGKYGRKVVFSGRSMKYISEMAVGINELTFDPDIVIEPEKANKLPPEKVLVICTGTQGEPFSALSKMSQGEFNRISVGVGDTVVLSSSPIPGNERMIYSVINNLYRRGAEVIYDAMNDIHATGHAFKEELKLMLQMVRPTYFVPVHGEYRHLVKHAQLARSVGIPDECIKIPQLGMTVAVNKKEFKQLSNIPAGRCFIDGSNLGDNADGIIRDRMTLAQEGFVIVFATVCLKTGEIIAGPDIIMRGITMSEAHVEEAKEAVVQAIKKIDFTTVEDYTDVKTAVRKALKKFISGCVKQYPMVVPVIIEG